ncbi:PLP-dependent aminotransferase family protein [Nocardioides speluncae]|uniref:MocR-like pyridoxine biosynthesis transcription factor PdxR n=1 Tax=Nocardioides speluncae TaxID=2670337 RepID=UPI000D692E7B|nr:PLP-dependent aminotransferase family protein [Nocardioides speluncae]
MATPAPLPLVVRRGAGTPLPAQLAAQVRELVTRGTLSSGTRLPSSRALAADLGVSRAVAEQAYEQLLAEGWLEARRGSGTFVAAVSPAGRPHPRPTPRPAASAEPVIRLGTGTPWIDPRQQAGWRRAWRDVAHADPPTGYPDPAGLPEVRAAIAAYVARTRGLDCGPDEVLVTLGTGDGLRHLLPTLPPGAVAFEDPGYRAAVAACEFAGRRVHDLPVDAEGASVEALAAMPDDVRAVYVTPAHQHPTGITMSAGRRLALLEEVRRRNACVVEDDYDSEFRYDVAPLPALATLDPERVVHLGTASKSVSPGLRLGWLVADSGLVAEIAERRDLAHDVPSWPAQRAWLSMLRDGHVDKLVRSARRVYAARAGLVVAALSPYGQIGQPVAGMYLTLALPGDVVEAVTRDCLAAGFDVPSLAETTRSSPRTGLVVGFGGVSDEELARALDVLTTALTTALARHT